MESGFEYKTMYFSAGLPENMITRSEALGAFDELRCQAADVPEMTLEEVNAEIRAARKVRKEE